VVGASGVRIGDSIWHRDDRKSRERDGLSANWFFARNAAAAIEPTRTRGGRGGFADAADGVGVRRAGRARTGALGKDAGDQGKQGRCRWEAARKSMISATGMRGPFSRHLPLTRIANRCGARRTYSRRATVVVPDLSAGVALRIG